MLRWRRPADDGESELRFVGQSSPGVLHFSRGELHHSGEVWRLVVEPQEPVVITAIEATLHVPLAQAEALYLNGYNSWTDSVERRPDERMRSFGVPRVVIDHWVLDGSGDYRFTRQDARPGHQHGFEYGYLRRGDNVLLVGSLGTGTGKGVDSGSGTGLGNDSGLGASSCLGLGADSGFTALYEDLSASTLTLCKEPPARVVAAGERLELLAFCVEKGSLDCCVERWLELAGVRPRACRPLVGYSSWYRHYGDISEAKLMGDLEGMRRALETLNTPGCDRLFQIDDGYAKVGDWLEVDARKFPQGLAPLAAAAREYGFVPGLWIAPFVCERESRLFVEHPDWLLRDGEGALVPTGSHWSGQVALDTQNPEVRAYVCRVLDTVTRGWGFEFLKCDFLYGACMVPHAGMNRGQLMADALELIRASVPEGCLLDFCGVPLVSAFGRAEFCRVGCDVGLDWDANWIMRQTGRERVSTKNSLADTRGRAHLNGRAFRADPDVFFLRRDVRLNERQRSELLDADARMGGMLLTSDDMGLWDGGQRAAYARALTLFCR